ncbi:hypothetical protein [Methylobacterium sp. 391_Methyba4]|uniref:hypothetical protein n=1 Tax=Methylobacterium sp. 391_Methyba4 TaxID=3038924 RepID=UPI00241F7CAA|nr:hypothetical protein [Methylobacterium sp. 391_Methyba4]WFS07627.1 hypothetical protein P9K36_30480 [Methylobacterium sp. 391_Methyba4]
MARKRRDQITAVLRDTNAGACRTDDAVLYVAEIIPHFAIACGQDGFWFALWEWIEANTPLVSRADVTEMVSDVLQALPRYNSVSTGRRMRVTIEQYDRLGLSHIRPDGWSRKRLDEHLDARRAKKVKEQRHACRESKTRRELSIAQLKPWKLPNAPCKSRAAFYREPENVRDALIAQAREAAAARQ